VACAPAGPGAVTIVAQGGGGHEPRPRRRDRPLTLQVLQLRGSGAFDGADFFGLQNASATLGGDLVKADTIVLAPGGKATKTIALEPPPP
jgi:type VI secretion system protein VasD